MPDPTAASRSNATIAWREELTETVAFFRVRPDGAAEPFVPGQYVTLGIASADRLVERPYSIASSAQRVDEGYELYVRLVPHGALTPLLFATRAGDRVALRRPKGRFVLRPDDRRTHLFVATGCGLAPFMSMLRTLADAATPRPIVLLHGVSYADELGYRDEIERLAGDPSWSLTYVPTVSRPREIRNAGWSGRTGRAEAVVGPLLAELAIPPERLVAYVCGNPEMTTAVDATLRAAGLDAAAIHKEQYWPLPHEPVPR